MSLINPDAGGKSAGLIRRELCSDTAYRSLARQNPRSVYSLAAFDMRKFDTGCGIEIKPLEWYIKLTGEYSILDERKRILLGETLIFSGKRTILYDDDAPGGLRRLNWTIAHEVGHNLLCHAEKSKLNEVEADVFASELLLPEPIIRKLDSLFGSPLQPETLTAWFNVSLAAASRRRAELDRGIYKSTASGEALSELLFPDKVFGYRETVAF